MTIYQWQQFLQLCSAPKAVIKLLMFSIPGFLDWRKSRPWPWGVTEPHTAVCRESQCLCSSALLSRPSRRQALWDLKSMRHPYFLDNVPTYFHPNNICWLTPQMEPQAQSYLNWGRLSGLSLVMGGHCHYSHQGRAAGHELLVPLL